MYEIFVRVQVRYQTLYAAQFCSILDRPGLVVASLKLTRLTNPCIDLLIE